jgi:hypothetical protein
MRYLIAATLIFHLNANAQLTGEIRNNFLSSMQSSCFNTQRQGSPNANISDSMIKQYCRCSSIYVADLLNNALLRDVESGKVKPNSSWNQLAADYCRINFSKY